MRLLLTLDVGTTAVKAGLFTETLDQLGLVIKEYTLLTPQNKWVEMTPGTYWDSAVLSIRQLIKDTQIDTSDIAGITCTTQGETLIPVDEDGNELSNAIVWLDSRADRQADDIKKRFTAEEFYAHTGCPEISAIWPVAKICWIKANMPGVYDSTYKFLLLEDYLVMKLTGRFVTNPALMSSTGYYDIISGTIWNEMLDDCSIEASKIPSVLPCGTKVGRLTKAASEALGLLQDVYVSTGAMDQVASAIGSGNIKEGVVTESTGTAQVVAATASLPDLSKRSPVTVYMHAIPEKYLLINVSQTAGIVLKWFRDAFCSDIVKAEGDRAFDAMGELAERAPILSKGVTLFPHFTGMQIPVTDTNTRGVFFGIGLDTGRECFIRAIMEGVGYMLRENMEALASHGIKPKVIYALGGGAKSRIWNQIKSDICDLDIAVMRNEESALLGAAVLGGLAGGILDGIEAACALIEEKDCVSAQKDNVALYENGYRVYQSMYERFKPLFDTKKENENDGS